MCVYVSVYDFVCIFKRPNGRIKNKLVRVIITGGEVCRITDRKWMSLNVPCSDFGTM